MENKRKKKKLASNCESCEFYEYDDYTDSYYCKMNLDEDEVASFLSHGSTGGCHYYRFYDEYKSVHKQI